MMDVISLPAPMGGTDVDDYIVEMVRLSKMFTAEVRGTFNDTPITVQPGDGHGETMARWMDDRRRAQANRDAQRRADRYQRVVDALREHSPGAGTATVVAAADAVIRAYEAKP